MRLGLLALASASCTALADFPPDRLAEVTDALCGNGVDDDADGLTDCQDWKCHQRAVCCDVPSVVLEDAFEGQACAAAACADADRGCAPDAERWTRWGVPYPYLCEDALVIGKDFASCYPVGVLSQATVALAPGVKVEARVSGRPERAARLEIGLTRQGTVSDGGDACAPIAPVPMMASVAFVSHDEGTVRFISTIEDTPFTDTILDDGPHRMSVAIDADRRLVFAVDDVPFGTYALAGELGFAAHVVASGLGMNARLDHVRVLAGTQCEAPEAWQPAAIAEPVVAPPAAWDGFERRSPNASLDDDGRVHLRYIGCTEDAVNPVCAAQTYAIGDAVASAGAPFERPEAPAYATAAIVAEGSIGLDFHAIESDQVAYFGVDVADGDLGVRIDRCSLDGTDIETMIEPGPGWEDTMCCPSVVSRGDERRLYYAGRAADDPAWRIGLAVSVDGGAFVPRPAPVVDVGEPGAFDDRSVSQPWVIHDEARGLYRMWYTATGELGRSSIGYAVSTDGDTWHKHDGPVLTEDDLDLNEIGSPTVIDDGGRLRMWVDGVPPGAVARTIYELENVGVEPP